MRISGRCRNFFYNLFKNLFYVQSGLCGNLWGILCLDTDHIFDLVDNTLRLCTWQIDLIDHRHNIQIYICQCLGFNSLCRIHHKDSAITGCEASGNLIVKVYMPGSVDQVEDIFFPVFCLIYGSHGLCLNSNSSLTFQIHIIQYLGLHLSFCQQTGHLNDPVCQGRFSVINMGYNTEITNFTLIKICHFSTSDFFLYTQVFVTVELFLLLVPST